MTFDSFREFLMAVVYNDFYVGDIDTTDTSIGYAVPAMGAAFRIAELLTKLHKIRPERRYALSAPRNRIQGNVDVRIVETKNAHDELNKSQQEIIVHLPTRLRDGRWLLTAWQFLEWEIESAPIVHERAGEN